MRSPLRNPPWADEVLQRRMPLLRDIVSPDLLPLEVAEPTPYSELGQGNYGVVYKTGNPAVVMKLTTDPSEADFVKTVLSTGIQPPGIVRYFDLVDLPDRAQFKDYPFERRTFVLWREAAFEVGKLVTGTVPGHTSSPSYMRSAGSQFSHALLIWRVASAALLPRYNLDRDRLRGDVAQALEGADARDLAWQIVSAPGPSGESMIERDLRWDIALRRYRGARRVAVTLGMARLAIDELMASELSHYVGDALSVYLDEGIFLADVHEGNIGSVLRDAANPDILANNGQTQSFAAITDPGHALFIDDRYDEGIANGHADVVLPLLAPGGARARIPPVLDTLLAWDPTR